MLLFFEGKNYWARSDECLGKTSLYVLQGQEPVGRENRLGCREQVFGGEGIELLEELLLGKYLVIVEITLRHADSHALEVIV